ncbi:MAG: hypothetical protein AAF384_14825 [Pseudomonadota bacterium]
MIRASFTVLCLVTLSSLAVVAPVSAATVLAHALNDWDSARIDGIGVGGSIVTPGSAADAAQHGHSDTTGNGTWRYIGIHNPTGGSFGGAPIEYSDWRDSISNPPGYYSSFRTFWREGFAPSSEASGTSMRAREWNSSGLQGQELRISGSFSTLGNTFAPSATNNGVQVFVAVDGFLQFDFALAPGSTVDFDFNYTPIANNQTVVRFGVGTNGSALGATIFNSFFNDATRFDGQIELVAVPVPAAAWLFGPALLMLGARLRREPSSAARHIKAR